MADLVVFGYDTIIDRKRKLVFQNQVKDTTTWPLAVQESGDEYVRIENDFQPRRLR